MLKIIPYNNCHKYYASKFFYEKEYAHFARGTGRYLNDWQLENLPEFKNREILIVLNNNVECGIILLFRESHDVVCGSLAIDKDFQGMRLMYGVEELMTNYCHEIIGAEIGKMEVLSKDKFLINALVKCGWNIVGEIPKYTKVLGVYEDVTFIYKSKRQ